MSLRKRLLLILGGTFVLIWGIAALWMLGELRQEVERVLDERLAASATMVAGLLEQIPPQPSSYSSLNPLSSQIFGLRSGLVCQVSNLRGEVLVRTPNMYFDESEQELLGFTMAEVDGESWRTYTVLRNNLLITTGDKMVERERLQHIILIAAASPVALALVGSLLLLWFGIGRGLAPLQKLRQQLAERDAEVLEPLPTNELPPELKPLVATLNQLLARVNEMLARERRFNDDAAHELRTPLTAIKTHLHVATRAQGEDAVVSLAKADAAVARMQSTLEQLLLLSRLGSDEDYVLDATANAQDIARNLLEQLYGCDGYERIEVISRLEQQVELAVPEPLAVVAVRNLLANALAHGAPEGVVSLEICDNNGWVSFKVCDQGEGLSAEDFSAAQQRFWRGRSAGKGSGLGLAIVAAIAHRFAAKLVAQQSSAGFCIELSFTKARQQA